ncbi:hypothetical protein HZA75_06500 [Candidatus Roizmanbacteria bacterium]|nr:hypothetical protein [Candidatus Roizmanbacteria bacterium]
MNIGFDLDKIFINTPSFVPDKLIDRLYKKGGNGDLWYRIPGPVEQSFRKLTHLPFMRPAIKKNIAFLKTISRKNNKLYLISSRYKFLKPETETIVKKYNFIKFFNDRFFNFQNKQPHIFKNEIIKKLKLDIYIDDDLSLLKYVAKNNPQIKFFWLNNGSQKINLPKNIIAIKNLPEIFNY